MIKPDDIKLSYEEFLALVEKSEKEALDEFKEEREKYGDIETVIRFWINVESKSIDLSYLDRLSELYKKENWSTVKIEFIEDRGEKLYILLGL